jgi:hypothetical protein
MRPTLEDLVAELRSNANDDLEFAQRVALACVALVETKADAIAAIRVTFRIQ